MKAFSVIVICLVLAGCSGGKLPSATTIKKVGLAQMSRDQETMLTTKGFTEDGSVLMTHPFAPGDPGLDPAGSYVLGHEMFAQVTYLRNPGVRVCLVRTGATGKHLTADEQRALSDWAAKNGYKVWPKLKIDLAVGPDKKTPMVMRSAMENTPSGGVGTITTYLGFPTKESAEAAQPYIGPGYKTGITSETKPAEKGAPAKTTWILAASFKGDRNLAGEEMSAFEPLAKRFGGEVLSTSAN